MSSSIFNSPISSPQDNTTTTTPQQMPIFSWFRSNTPIDTSNPTFNSTNTNLNNNNNDNNNTQTATQSLTNLTVSTPLTCQSFPQYLSSPRLDTTLDSTHNLTNTLTNTTLHSPNQFNTTLNQSNIDSIMPKSPNLNSLAQLINVQNVNKEKLLIDQNRLSSQINALTAELSHQKQSYDDITNVPNHDIDKNYQNENYNNNSNDVTYQLDPALITSHPDHWPGRLRALEFSNKVDGDRRRNKALHNEYIVQLQRKIEELIAEHHAIEMERIQAEAQRLQTIERYKKEEERQEQLTQLAAQQEQLKQQEILQQQQKQQQDDAIRLQEQQRQLQQQQLLQQQQVQSQNDPVSVLKPNTQQKLTNGNSGNTTKIHKYTTSPSQRLNAQMEAFGLDAKLIHFYTYNYIFTSFCQLHLRNQTVTVNDDDLELIYIASLWSWEARNCTDFPSIMYEQLQRDRSNGSGIFDEKYAGNVEKMSVEEKLAITRTNIMPYEETNDKVNNIYNTLDINVQFFRDFSLLNGNDTLLPLMKPLFSLETAQIFEKIQTLVNFDSFYSTMNVTLIPSAAKLAKTYVGIGQTIARFGGIVACQANLQSPSKLKLQKYHPSITLLIIIKFYHALLQSTSDAYLLGMTFALLAQLTPFFHYIPLGSLLHSHRHNSKSLRFSSSNTNTTTTAVVQGQNQLVLNQYTPEYNSNLHYNNCTRSCTNPQCNCFLGTSKHAKDDGPQNMIDIRIKLLTAYIQSIDAKDNGLCIDNYLFTQPLGTLRGGVKHPNTNITQLREILDSLHLDFAYFTSQFGKIIMTRMKKQQNLATTTTTTTTNNNNKYSSLYPIIQQTTWERCKCCGYNSISIENVQTNDFVIKQFNQLNKHNNNNNNNNITPTTTTTTSGADNNTPTLPLYPQIDPHWSHSVLINQPKTLELIQNNDGSNTSLSQSSPTTTTTSSSSSSSLYPLCPYPTLFPFTSFSLECEPISHQYAQHIYNNVNNTISYPNDLIPTDLNTNNNIIINGVINTDFITANQSLLSNPRCVVKMSNRPRLQFLWGWFANLLNIIPFENNVNQNLQKQQGNLQKNLQNVQSSSEDSIIPSTYMDVLLPSLTIAGFQLRLSYGDFGHTLLQTIYQTLLKNQVQLTTTINGKKILKNQTTFNSLIARFNDYHKNANTTFPYDIHEKLITLAQSSDISHQEVTLEGNTYEACQ